MLLIWTSLKLCRLVRLYGKSYYTRQTKSVTKITERLEVNENHLIHETETIQEKKK